MTLVSSRIFGEVRRIKSGESAEHPPAPTSAAASPTGEAGQRFYRFRWPAVLSFDWLGALAVRRPLTIIGLWIVASAVLMLTLPSLKEIGNSNPSVPLPPDAPSRVAAQAMVKAYGESGSQNLLLVLLTDIRGLSPGDEATYRQLVATLGADKRHVLALQDFVATPDIRDLMTSADKKAWILPVSLVGDPGTPQADNTFKQVVSEVKAVLADRGDTSLTASFAGPAATAGEIATRSERDVHVIGIASAVIVLAILLIVYRNLVTVLLPLATIGIATVVAQRSVAGLAHLGLAVSSRTIVLMTVTMLGAGTGYAVFLISRYHEFLRSGSLSDDAVRRSLASTGNVFAAWAATLAAAFLAVRFARLGVFSTVGPALAVTVAVGFLAAVTLLPALLCVAGRRGWIAPSPDLTAQFWRRSAVTVVRRPVPHLVLSVVVLIALAACTFFVRVDHDDRNMLSAASESNRGYAAIEKHFPNNSAIPLYLLVRSPHDLRTSRSLADLELMASRVSQVPDVSVVRGLTRPGGQPLERAKVSYQVGRVGSQLSGAASHIADEAGELNSLRDGSKMLADTLASISATADQSLGMVGGLVDAAADLAQQFDSAQTLDLIDGALLLVKRLNLIGDMMGVSLADQRGFFNVVGPVVEGLNASPVCNVNASCSATRAYLVRLVHARDDGTFDTLSDFSRKLQAVQGNGNIDEVISKLHVFVRAAINAVRSLGINGTSALRKQIDTWLTAATGLAQGSHDLSEGVQALVERTRKMGVGLNQAGEILSVIRNDASQPSMAGFFIPEQALASPDFKNVAATTVSEDGHMVRYLVQSKLSPFSTAAMEQVDAIQNAARSAQPNTTLSDATISLAGIPVVNRDVHDYSGNAFRYVSIVMILVALAVLMLLLRAVVAPLYLVGSAIVGYLAALGIGVVVFQVLLHQPLSWTVPGTAFLVLIAVGANYNLLLISRVHDYSPRAIRSGVIRSATSVGGAITAAGVIFAASMFSLVFSSMTAVTQIGFVVGVGLLLDAFLVRTFTVPALSALVGRINWWPSGAMAALRRRRALREAITAAVYRGELLRPEDIRPVFSRSSRRTAD